MQCYLISMGNGRAAVDRKNVVLTGLPRSGTTLACYLLNKVPDTVALSEAFTPGRSVKLRGEAALCDRLDRFFGRMRRMIDEEKAALSKQIGGEVPANPFDQEKHEGGARRQLASKGRISITKELSPDFLLIIKQPGLFTLLLPTLLQRFPCYALVRNPLAVLASWNSLETGNQKGRFPLAEMYDEDLVRRLDAEQDDAGRQLCLMSWFFERYRQNLPEGSVIRYEEMVASGGKALSPLVPAAESLDEPLQSKNLSPLYDRRTMSEMGERLLESEGAYWHFYSREEVENLMRRVDENGP